MSTNGSAPATVVLVHGAWHGPWCFDRVVEGLESRGVTAVAVDRRRRHEASGELRGVTDSTENERIVREALDAVEGPVVLLGHSFGGVPITTVPLGGDQVKHLVYLTALMPSQSEAMSASLANPDLVDAIVPGDDGSTTVRPELIEPTFYGQCSEADVEWATSQLVRDEAAIPFDTVRATAWSEIPTTYVVCTEDQALTAAGQRKLAKRANRVVEWASDHSPFLSHPGLMVDLLDDLAREYGS